MERIIKDSSGNYIVNKSSIEQLKELSKELKEKEEKLNSLKEELLKEMISKDVKKIECNNMCFTTVIGKDIEKFNEMEFMNNEDSFFVDKFIEEKEVETPFDLEKFKEENPELYKKYAPTITNFNVNTKLLEKSFPKIYRKYLEIIPSNRKSAIKIVEK